MVGITITGDNSGSIPHLSSKKSSTKPKDMNTTIIIIIFGLIGFGITFGLIFVGYWKTSSELNSIKKWIKMQDNMSTTTTTIPTPSTTTLETTTTTFEKEEFGTKSCDDIDDVLSWMKCEKNRKERREREENEAHAAVGSMKYLQTKNLYWGFDVLEYKF